MHYLFIGGIIENSVIFCYYYPAQEGKMSSFLILELTLRNNKLCPAKSLQPISFDSSVITMTTTTSEHISCNFKIQL